MARPANQKSTKNYKGAGWWKSKETAGSADACPGKFFLHKKQYLDITPMSCILYLLN